MMTYARPLAQLLEQLEKLPGVGPKSAQRLAFHILRAPRADSQGLAQAVLDVRDKIHPCRRCGNFTDLELCAICTDARREGTLFCVVAEARDLMAIENSGEFRGQYHVLGGVMNPMEGIGPDQLSVNALVKRIEGEAVAEVILALSPTVEGETTANYLANLLRPRGVQRDPVGARPALRRRPRLRRPNDHRRRHARAPGLLIKKIHHRGHRGHRGKKQDFKEA